MQMNRLLVIVGCSLIAAAHAQSFSPRQQAEFLLKSFWDSPSLQAFVEVGEWIHTLLPPERAMREEDLDNPRRPPIPLFEAVKKRLAEGIIVRGPVSSRPESSGDTLPDPLAKNIKRAVLPSVRSSFFGSEEPFIVPLRPFTLADQFVSFADALSAFHHVTIRMKVLGPARLGPHGVSGVWDVGTAGITFAKPVRINGLAANGTATGADITSLRADFATNCGEPGLNTIGAKSITAGWRGAILAWIGKTPDGTASMSTRQLTGKDRYEKLVIDTIDVDRDSVPDFSIWSGLEQAVASTDTFWKAVFVNIAGKWELLAFAQEADCT